MSKFIIAQLGARQRYEIPLAFQTIGWLQAFITDYWSPFGKFSPWLMKNTHNKIFKRSLERWSPELNSQFVHSNILFGIKSSLILARENDVFERSKIILEMGKIFSKLVMNDAKQINHDSFFGFCSESLEVLQYEKLIGNTTFLDQYDCANDEEYIDMELDCWQGWKPSSSRIDDYYQRVYEEWRLSDCIIVNSEWTQMNIIRQGAPAEKIHVVPLSYTPKHNSILHRKPSNNNLKVLYVGGINLRKGVQYLVACAEKLQHTNIKFIFIGAVEVEDKIVDRFPPNIVLTGHLPYEKVKEYYEKADIFVFPTLSDGFGRVQLEAMEYGLPVIATSNCGKVVENGVNGFVVPPKDSNAIAEKLLLLEADRETLLMMSIAAVNTIQKFSRVNYMQKLLEAINKANSKNTPISTIKGID